MEREKIVQRFEQDVERITAGMVLDRISLVEKTGQSQTSDFFDPFQQRTADRVLHYFKDLKSVIWGGFAEAERARLLVYPATHVSTATDVALAFLEADAGLQAAELTHRDFLGAVLGLGLRREKIGDILLVGEGKAQVVAHPDILSFLLTNWLAVGNHSIRLREIAAEELMPAPPRVKEIKTTRSEERRVWK